MTIASLAEMTLKSRLRELLGKWPFQSNRHAVI